jgi:hypothetical protein
MLLFTPPVAPSHMQVPTGVRAVWQSGHMSAFGSDWQLGRTFPCACSRV